MFNVGDYVVYGANGVCKVEKVGKLNLSGIENDKLYYTLTPVYSSGTRIYTSVDNKKVTIRPILSKGEALELIDKIPDIDEMHNLNDRGREQIYKETIKSCDCKKLVRIIKTLYNRKKALLADGKRITTVDEKYMQSAEELLYGELAIPLEMDVDHVEQYIFDKVSDIE